LLIIIIVIFLGTSLRKETPIIDPDIKMQWWKIQSIDSVKYSRDVAREKANDETFNEVIDNQTRLIAATGATHIAIGTPYAEEFVPFLKRWVSSARKYNLKVWFRGNVPGWEEWFNYPKITKEEHINKVRDFIIVNADIFAEGDIFSSCPECENGSLGDPRQTGEITSYRQFLIDEYRVTNDTFRKIGKNVRSNFIPMNGDVANLIMDKETTQALGGIVVIDHYVKDGNKLASDIKSLAEKSGGKVILGEFGAPIPDIHGKMTYEEQATWLNESLKDLSEVSQLEGINYWTGFGGSTQIWQDNYTAKPAVAVIEKYYKPHVIYGIVTNQLNEAVKGAQVFSNEKSTTTDDKGYFSLPSVNNSETLSIKALNYLDDTITANNEQNTTVILEAKQENILFKIRKLLSDLL
jgi:hypothetical protein